MRRKYEPELAQYEAFAKEILRRVMVEDDPADIRHWMNDTILRLGGSANGEAVMTWEQSFDLVDQMLMEYAQIAATPEKDRKSLTWPWQSWRNLIDPLEDGMLGLVTAPDGQGKTIVAESVAEHWAEHKLKVAFVHFELNRKLMMLRRTARHAQITSRILKSGKLTPTKGGLWPRSARACCPGTVLSPTCTRPVGRWNARSPN